MKIKEIRAFSMKPLRRLATTGAGRPYWGTDTEVAGPMSRYPRFKRHRSLWRPTWPDIGCIVFAEDGQWGFGTGRYGAPVAAVINDHFAPPPARRVLLRDREAVGHDGEGGLSVRRRRPRKLRDQRGRFGALGPQGQAPATPCLRTSWRAGAGREICYATGNDTDWYMELGFKATKLACPYGFSEGLEGLDRNEELVAGAREIVGPKIELMLDCWMAFDVEFTVRMAERLRPYGLKWIEDCLMPEDIDGFAEVRAPTALADAGDRRALVYAAGFLARGGEAPRGHLPTRHQLVGRRYGSSQDLPHRGGRGHPGHPACGHELSLRPAFRLRHAELPMGRIPASRCTRNAPGRGQAFSGHVLTRDGFLVPSNAPGFGMDITLEWIDERVA